MNNLADSPTSAPTLLEQRNLVEAWLKAQNEVASQSTIPPRADGRWAPASSGQEQLWLHSNLAGNQLLYNEPVTVHYHGVLDVQALTASVMEFIHRHEAWRTTFVHQSGTLKQKIHARLDVAIPFNDLTDLPKAKRESRAIDLARKDAMLPFDLFAGPLLRCRLIKLAPDLHRLYLCLHHIIFDGVSLYNVFLPELAVLYRARATRTEHQLAPPEIQYGDYAAWHRQYILSEAIESQADYWRASLQGMKDLDIPCDHPRGKQPTFRGAMEIFFVPKATVNSLRDIGQRLNATLFMVLTGVLAAQLKLWTGAEDIPIGSACSARKWSETERTVGFFLNTFVLRIDASNDPTFIQLVERIKQTLLEAMENDELPFPMLVQKLNAPRDSARHPLFQVVFSLEPPLPELDPGWEFTQMDVETGVTKFDLHVEMDERADGLLARFIYNTDLFEHTSIRRAVNEWLRIAREVATTPDMPLSALNAHDTGKLMRRLRRLLQPSSGRRSGSLTSPNLNEKVARR